MHKLYAGPLEKENFWPRTLKKWPQSSAVSWNPHVTMIQSERYRIGGRAEETWYFQSNHHVKQKQRTTLIKNRFGQWFFALLKAPNASLRRVVTLNGECVRGFSSASIIPHYGSSLHIAKISIVSMCTAPRLACALESMKCREQKVPGSEAGGDEWVDTFSTET